MLYDWLLGSISQTVYANLLHAQIPKEQKRLYGLTVFFALLGSSSIKAFLKMLVKLAPVLWILSDCKLRHHAGSEL